MLESASVGTNIKCDWAFATTWESGLEELEIVNTLLFAAVVSQDELGLIHSNTADDLEAFII